MNALTGEQRAQAVIWHRPPPDFATRLVPRIGEVELPDHVFEPEPDYRISDEERSALAYVRSGPRGIGGADLTAEQLYALVDLVARFAGRLPARGGRGGAAPGGRGGGGEPVVRVGGRHASAASGTTTACKGPAC